jgi:FkbM family methyltransferase
MFDRLFARKSADAPTQQSFKIPTCEERLEHASQLGFRPNVVFDCGAFIGRWAKSVFEMFPKTKIIMFEPNIELNDHIKKNLKGQDNYILENVAVGENEGEVVLNVWENAKHANPLTKLAASSLLGHVQGDASKKLRVPLRTIDQVAAQHATYPDLIKLDLQGAELPALKGAEKSLEKAEMCIIEFGCLDAYIERTTPNHLMAFMYERDFVLYDIVDLRYRPYDGALVGGDYFFVKKSSNLKVHKDYF